MTNSTHVYDAIAQAVAAEGVEVVFHLMGDGNMMWLTSFTQLEGRSLVHARHESMAVAMADAYAQVTGRLGVCSVTSGPGLTQVPTSLVAAARTRTPLVLIAGDTPREKAFQLQAFDQSPLVRSTGAEFIAVRDRATLAAGIRLAFHRARQERLPVVLSIPQDIQEAPLGEGWHYLPSGGAAVPAQRIQPDARLVEDAARLLAAAQRPVIVAGRGAVESDAYDAIVALADRLGALLGATLRGHGLFRGHDFDIGLVGGFSSPVTRRLVAESDCVLAVGARVGFYTTAGGSIFGEARVIQVDTAPAGIVDGVDAVDLRVIGDARATVEAIDRALGASGAAPERAGYRTDEVRRTIAAGWRDEVDLELEPGTVDPRAAMEQLDRAMPDDWLVVMGYGHFWDFAAQHLRGREPLNQVYTAIGFGAIGQGLAAAIGAAVGRPDRKVVLVDGDGSFMMNLQELETVARYGLSICVVLMDDGAYGSEIQRFRAWNMPEEQATFGRTNFAGIAEALGLRGVTVDADNPDLAAAIEQFAADGRPTVIDVHVSRTVPSVPFRRYFPEDHPARRLSAVSPS